MLELTKCSPLSKAARAPEMAPLADDLLDVLVDPVDREPLWYFEREQLLVNPRRGVAYEVREEIAILLVDEAKDLSEADVAAFRLRKDEVRVTGGGEAI